MITAVHTLVYSDDAEATHAFFRDVLGLPFIDAQDGWLIFKTGPSELGVHPTRSEYEGKVYESPVHHADLTDVRRHRCDGRRAHR